MAEVVASGEVGVDDVDRGPEPPAGQISLDLLACQERVQESVFFSVANLLNLEVDVIFFDYPADRVRRSALALAA